MSDIFPYYIGQKVVCVRGEAGLSITPHAERLTTGHTYIVRDVTPNYSKVRTLDGHIIGGSFGNWRFEAVEEEPTPALKELVRRGREHDAVKHPSHYTDVVPGIECIDVVKHLNFCRGNAVKYIWRAGMKGDAVEDLRKAIQNLEFEIERLEALNG